MLGDKIVVKPHHTKAAEGVYEKVRDRVVNAAGRVAVTVAGESGSGKSEIGSEIARIFKEKEGLESVIFHQDDYFIYPPKTNDRVRRENINNVGMQEVRLDLLDEHIKKSKQPETTTLTKPLIDYDNNTVLEETCDLSGKKLIIAEGTYTTALNNADIKVFIDRTYLDTFEHRKERARDYLDEYAENILKIEHEIISAQKKMADVIITREYGVEN